MAEEKTIIKDKMDKTEVHDMPRVIFWGRIITVNTQEEARKAVDYLLDQSILGIDTETKPTFHRGEHNKVALLQVATHDTCFLFRLNFTGLTDDIKRLLEDRTVPKIGLSLHDDLLALSQRGDFKPGTFIDIQDEVKEIGIEDLSLQKIYANLFGLRISKAKQLSNWEADTLTEPQKKYAATDAWACVRIYDKLKELEQTHDYQLVTTPQEPAEQTEA